MKNSIIIAIVIILAVMILSYFQYANLELKRKEIRIEQESYISTLITSYKSEVQACKTAAVNSKPEDLNTFIKENCLDPINKSRVADLLRSWGKENVLETEMKQ